MKITKTELRQIIREELNKELHKEGVLDRVKGFFGYGDKEEPTGGLETFSIKDIKNKISPTSRPEKEEILFVLTSMSKDEEAKELFNEYPSLFRNLPNLKLQNKKLSGARFKEVNFSGAEFNNVIFEDCVFEDCNLHSSKFNNCKLTKVRVFGGIMDRAKIHRCKASNVALRPSSANGASFYNFNFNDWGFQLFDYGKVCKQIMFNNCDFENHFLAGKFVSSIFMGCNFASSTISGKFSGRNQFASCVFKDINFDDSVQFKETAFNGCKFLDCIISSSKVFGEEISFNDVNVKGTSFDSVVSSQGETGSPIFLDSKNPEPCPTNLEIRVKCVKNESDGTVMIVDKNAV